MIHLLEAIWYAFLILIKVLWLPVVIIVAVALIAKLIGTLKRKSKESKKEKK